MFNISNFITTIEENINALVPSGAEWKFKIFEDFGELENFRKENQTTEEQRIINGVAIQRPGEITPIQGLSNFDYILDLAVFAPANPYGEDYAAEVKVVMEEFIAQNVGAATEVDGYAVLTNLDLLATGQYEQLPNMGSEITFSTTIYCKTIKDGVISNVATIKLNGEPLIWFSFSLDNSRIPQADTFENERRIMNVILRQGNTYGFMIPYRNTPQLQALVKAIWKQDLTTQWELEYNDPVAGNQKDTVVMTQGTLNLEGGKIGTITVQFATGLLVEV